MLAMLLLSQGSAGYAGHVAALACYSLLCMHGSIVTLDTLLGIVACQA